jgi:hypothetical protein
MKIPQSYDQPILTPGTWYQDVLEDGTVTQFRKNYPTPARVDWDKRAPVARTLRIVISEVTQYDPYRGKNPLAEQFMQRTKDVV